MTEIKKVAVIGAGVMGASIAAHVANAGVPVVLLDIVAKDNPNRSAIAEGALEKLLKADPAPFMSKAAAKFVTTGNVEDNLDLLGDCDWIIEAVIERLDVKQALYARIEAGASPAAWFVQYLFDDPPATLLWKPVWPAGCRELHHHPFLQSGRAYAAFWKWSAREVEA
ncbi:protein of unknown function (plasmid) [Methylocella tundrae]|uniref:3-hydroxyacyl-CoA dehydrogenase NAD binding domain-containing protein n=1 Tax=Methylocella tundrae TaxID=227605 RepID=A0A4U8Z7V0_METTU|nr:3-hydroxyacyl-CoA dehydrogenase NAD-binding domain-containing protein [Methylocella tundrae]VFU16538.1 protein of unknown function [Methylocella tundrae]